VLRADLNATEDGYLEGRFEFPDEATMLRAQPPAADGWPSSIQTPSRRRTMTLQRSTPMALPHASDQAAMGMSCSSSCHGL
jgi:hypothetical protein